ncbi:isoprenylcysteine carboxylmethyltransferase family protein [Candidatus Bathyarchaeota archaeon]|nr:isoprenylcysteine carboxylmethyltransferase family protein [Candidatus Bathyarchaeota archaeon]
MYNFEKFRKVKKKLKHQAEVEHPKGLLFVLAALGTFAFFIESASYIILVFTSFHKVLTNSWLQLRFPSDSLVQAVGLLLTAFGYFLFIWSVLSRGRYATSWEMPENHKLVTWGPYRYVRHPAYLAYFILFAGLILTLLNLIAMIPLIAVPGYIKIASIEEELLIKRFGNEYQQYQQTTGKFFPKRKSSNSKIK